MRVSYITLAGSSRVAGGPQSVVGLQSHGLIVINWYLDLPPRLCAVMRGEADNAGDMVGSMGNGYCPLKLPSATTAHPACRHFNLIRDVDCVCIYCIFFCTAQRQ